MIKDAYRFELPVTDRLFLPFVLKEISVKKEEVIFTVPAF